jgi:hypothetical protein
MTRHCNRDIWANVDGLILERKKQIKAKLMLTKKIISLTSTNTWCYAKWNNYCESLSCQSIKFQFKQYSKNKSEQGK